MKNIFDVKKLIFLILIVFPVYCFAGPPGSPKPTAGSIVSLFSGTPDGTKYLRDDETLQTPSGGSGDVTGVGDCASGACLDGSSDGGTYVRLYDGDSNYLQIDVGDLGGDVTVNYPTSAGTLLLNAADTIDSGQYVDGSIDVEHIANSAVGVVTASKAAAYTIGTDDGKEAYGGVIYVTGAATITAPAVAVRMNFTVITIGAVAVSLDVNASDRMYLDGTALDDGDQATNTSTTGDMIYCAYESANGWYCASGSPDGDHWTDGG